KVRGEHNGQQGDGETGTEKRRQTLEADVDTTANSTGRRQVCFPLEAAWSTEDIMLNAQITKCAKVPHA
ncbi:hypothetical protein HispidOSU_007448, partial [Sigmodon hispidus]